MFSSQAQSFSQTAFQSSLFDSPVDSRTNHSPHPISMNDMYRVPTSAWIQKQRSDDQEGPNLQIPYDRSYNRSFEDFSRQIYEDNKGSGYNANTQQLPQHRQYQHASPNEARNSCMLTNEILIICFSFSANQFPFLTSSFFVASISTFCSKNRQVFRSASFHLPPTKAQSSRREGEGEDSRRYMYERNGNDVS